MNIFAGVQASVPTRPGVSRLPKRKARGFPRAATQRHMRRCAHSSMLSDESPDFLEPDNLHHSSQARPAICGFIVCHVTARDIISVDARIGKRFFSVRQNRVSPRVLPRVMTWKSHHRDHPNGRSRATVSANFRSFAFTRPLTESSGQVPSSRLSPAGTPVSSEIPSSTVRMGQM
jgi:hypothetical protein